MMPLISPPRFLIDEIVLFAVLAFFLSIATVSFLWFVLKKIFPDEVKDFRFLLTFIIVIIPFVIIVCFGAALINYNAIATQLGWPEVLPVNSLLPPATVGAAAFYIGQTIWLWWDWRKLRIQR
jgi:amino acid transporter